MIKKMNIDITPWLEDGQAIRLTQDQWSEKYNQAGKIMASAPDFYAAIKRCDDDLIAGLREDFDNWLTLSTRLSYNPDNLRGKIIHYHGSSLIEPIESELVIPVFKDTPIKEAIVSGQHAEEGLSYLQTYFGTQDSAWIIIKALEKVSGKSKNNIKIWTANIYGNYTRVSHPERAAFIGFSGLNLFVGGLFYDDGRSRGVKTGGTWLVPGRETAAPFFPYDIQSGISRKYRSVHFSNIHEICGFERYDGLFCFEGERYVVSLIRRKGINKRIKNDSIAQILSEKSSTDEKVEMLDDLNPTYVHIARYCEGIKIDDSEGFKSLID
jgi:hypothetical protein